MENKQGGTAGVLSRPCVDCFRAEIDSEIRGHSKGMSFLFSADPAPEDMEADS